jgi:hypothetical protein
MELNVQEKNSTTWRKIDEYLTERISSAQRTLEGPLDGERTTALRGRIHAFRMLQSLGDDVPIIDLDE